jgi:hypothetical protein
MPNWWQLFNAGIKRCQHRLFGTCATEVSGCCPAVACAICVKLVDGGTEEVVAATEMDFDGDGYSGQVRNTTFESYWEADPYTGECSFHVWINRNAYAEQHLVFSRCNDDAYDGASCKNPAGEATVEDAGEELKLIWSGVNPLTLARRLRVEPTDYQPGQCAEHFCGDCDCAPRKLCVTLSGASCYDVQLVEFSGAENDCGETGNPQWPVTFACDLFTWAGMVSIVRDDQTKQCRLQLSGGTDDYDQTEQSVVITECRDLTGEFTISVLEYGAEEESSYSVTIKPADCDTCDPPDLCRGPFTACGQLTSISVEFPGIANVDCNDCEAMNSSLSLISCEVVNDNNTPGNNTLSLLFYGPTLNRGDCGDSASIAWIEISIGGDAIQGLTFANVSVRYGGESGDTFADLRADYGDPFCVDGVVFLSKNFDSARSDCEFPEEMMILL